MKNILPNACALAALIAGLSTSVPVQAGAAAVGAAPACSVTAPAVLHRVVPGSALTPSTFAIIRVTLGPDGVDAARKLMWNSGDAAFNERSMRAAASTTFGPASRACAARPAVFDYAFVSMPDAGHVRSFMLSKRGF